jgi:hypothetical protein
MDFKELKDIYFSVSRRLLILRHELKQKEKLVKGLLATIERAKTEIKNNEKRLSEIEAVLKKGKKKK